MNTERARRWKPHIRLVGGRWHVAWRSFDGLCLRRGADIFVPRTVLQGNDSMAAHHFVKRMNNRSSNT
jgi:hypothetical protein